MVPTGLGCLVAMKMPPREMFTAYFWMNVSTSGYFSLIRIDVVGPFADAAVLARHTLIISRARMRR